MIYTHILTYLLGEDLHRFENPCGRKRSDQNLGYLIDRGLYFIHIFREFLHEEHILGSCFINQRNVQYFC